ncbi:MAG: DUF2029 domain-containing protein [Flavobacteriales bacterium]|nr:DUF2029 domain-containing protein [Flavobacteriales bacterium]
MKKITIVYAVAWVVAMAVLPFIPRTSFLPLCVVYATAFAAYMLICRPPNSGISKWILGLAIAGRAFTFLSPPQLSDDYYRFIWDARLTTLGEDPYLLTPEQRMTETPVFEDARVLFDNMNSPGYHSVYPPLLQYIWAAALWISPAGIPAEVQGIRFFLFLAELGTLLLLPRLLKRWSLPPEGMCLYALNPLVISEICGNLHPEGAMIFFLVAAGTMFGNGRNVLSGIFFGLAILVKLIPLMFLPLLWKRLGSRVFFSWCMGIGITIAGGLFTMDVAALSHIAGSLSLYFTNFEFNSSVYAALHPLALTLVAIDPIRWLAPLLACFSAIIIIFIALRNHKAKSPIVPAGHSWMVYLLLGTTIHPWYLSGPVLLSCIVRQPVIIWWSGLVVLSYGYYDADTADFPWRWIEYGGLAVCGILTFRKQHF